MVTKRISPNPVIESYCHRIQVSGSCALFGALIEAHVDFVFGQHGYFGENNRKQFKQILNEDHRLEKLLD